MNYIYRSPKKLILLLCMVFIPMGRLFSQDSDVLNKLNQIKWITEQYPPFNYVDNDGQLKGLMVDILIEIWKKTGIKKTKKDIVIAPWTSGILMLEKDPLVCLFGMGMTNGREKKYNFVSSVSTGVYGLIAKKSKKFRFKSTLEINEFFKGKSKIIGAIRNNFGSLYFTELGGNPDLLFHVGLGYQLVKMLETDRVEMISFAELPAIAEMIKNNIKYKNYEIVMVSKKIRNAFAFNKNADPNVLKVLQNAFDKVNEEGTSEMILKKYLSRFDKYK